MFVPDLCNNRSYMKATINIVTASKDFRQDQLAIMKRIMLVLNEHGSKCKEYCL